MDIHNLHNQVIEIARNKELFNINIVIQVQSYNRVFLWDQLGVVVHQDEAICVIEGENIDTKIKNAYTEYLNKLQAYKKE